MGITPYGGQVLGYGDGGLMPHSPGQMQKANVSKPQPGNAQNADKRNQASLQKLKDDNYRHIMAHEMAHASAAGSLGGGINIVYDGNGVPVAGFVPITIPGINPNNPEQSLAQARQVYSAAVAPGGDMSAADSGVASRAMSVMGRAQVLMSQKQQRQRLENSVV